MVLTRFLKVVTDVVLGTIRLKSVGLVLSLDEQFWLATESRANCVLDLACVVAAIHSLQLVELRSDPLYDLSEGQRRLRESLDHSPNSSPGDRETDDLLIPLIKNGGLSRWLSDDTGRWLGSNTG